MTRDNIIDVIASSIRDKRKTILANQNLHGVYLHWTNATFRELHRRALIFIDGMSLVAVGALTNRKILPQYRNTPLDWILPALKLASEQGWRVFYLGGTRDSVQTGIRALRARVSGLEIAGRDGFFNLESGSPETKYVLECINDFRPHILCVGMGMPIQERWILRNFSHVDANVFIPAGSLIDYFSGVVPVPPRCLGRIELEWLFRLAANPRRYSGRYLVEPWMLAGLMLRAAIANRICPSEGEVEMRARTRGRCPQEPFEQ